MPRDAVMVPDVMRTIYVDPRERYPIVSVDFEPDGYKPGTAAIYVSGFRGPISAGCFVEIIRSQGELKC